MGKTLFWALLLTSLLNVFFLIQYDFPKFHVQIRAVDLLSVAFEASISCKG